MAVHNFTDRLWHVWVHIMEPLYMSNSWKAIIVKCCGSLSPIVQLGLSRYSLFGYHLKQGLSTGPHCNYDEHTVVWYLRTERKPGPDSLCEDSDRGLVNKHFELNGKRKSLHIGLNTDACLMGRSIPKYPMFISKWKSDIVLKVISCLNGMTVLTNHNRVNCIWA